MFFKKLVGFTIALFIMTAIHAAASDKREKVIDFEDEVVEGLNKKPLDSANQISERDGKKHQLHLYRKRAGFRSETEATLRELRYFQ